MILTGVGRDGKPKQQRFMIIARSGHGPCIPAIVLAHRLVKGEVRQRGAIPCVDLIDLDAYLAALEGLDISVIRDLPDA